MQASRLVSILLLLQVHGQMTAGQLAAELEVSVRTIYRDLDGLAAAGVPLYAERGAAGGYRLVDGYRTRLTGLSADEAQALFLSGLEQPAAQLGLGTVLAAAQLKVMAALPPELRGRASRLRERFLLVAPGWFREDEEVVHLETVARGVWESRCLEVTYRGPDGPVARRLEPLGLVLKAGVWYLVARRDGALRTYRVSRIAAAACLDERFERPAPFDLVTHWSAAEATFEAGLRRVPVTVRVRVDALGALDYALGGISRPGLDAAGRGGPPSDGAGWTRLSFPVESLETAHDDLLRLGGRVEVLAPPELRDRLRATIAEMADRYRAPGEGTDRGAGRAGRARGAPGRSGPGRPAADDVGRAR